MCGKNQVKFAHIYDEGKLTFFSDYDTDIIFFYIYNETFFMKREFIFSNINTDVFTTNVVFIL